MAAQGHRQKRGHGRQTHGPDRWTPHIQVRRDGLTVIDLAPYTLLDTDGTITIRVPDEATQGLPAGAGAWDLLLEDPSGDVTRLAAGPALVETTVSDTERSPH